MSDCDSSIEQLQITVRELEKRFDLHQKYQEQAVGKAAIELKEKLVEMNQFREENLRDRAKYATIDSLNERTQTLDVRIEHAKALTVERAERNQQRIEELKSSIFETLGARITVLELYKANIDGRFWAWGILLTLISLAFQFWPVLRGH